LQNKAFSEICQYFSYSHQPLFTYISTTFWEPSDKHLDPDQFGNSDSNPGTILVDASNVQGVRCTWRWRSYALSECCLVYLLSVCSDCYYAALPYSRLQSLRVAPRPSVPCPTVNSETENHTTFKLRAEVADVRSNWQSNFELKSSSKFTVMEPKKEGPHIVSASGTVLNCFLLQFLFLHCSFLPRNAMHSADYAVIRRLSVCLSVCLSVTRRYSVERARHIIKLISSLVATPA